jgi:hypothetical protein
MAHTRKRHPPASPIVAKGDRLCSSCCATAGSVVSACVTKTFHTAGAVVRMMVRHRLTSSVAMEPKKLCPTETAYALKSSHWR